MRAKWPSQNSCLLSFKTIKKQPLEKLGKKVVHKNSAIFKDVVKTPVLETLFNSENCEIF